ncbi:MAG: flippase [Thermoplasmata archaeon]
MPNIGPGRMVSGIGWNIFGVVIGSAAGILTSIILARLLGPANYGTLALTLSILNVLVVFSSLGFEFALNKYIPILLEQKMGGAIRSVVARLIVIKLGISIALAVFIFIAAGPIAEHLFKKPVLANYFRLLGLMVVPYSLEPIFKGVLTGFYMQKFINLVDAGAKILYLVVAATVLIAGQGVAGVLMANLLANLMFVTMAARRSWSVMPEAKRGRSFPMRPILRYSLFLFVYTIMNFLLGQQLDLLMIGSMLEDVREVAFYTIAYSLSYMVLSFFSLALMGGITLTYFSELHARKDMEGLRRGYTVMLEYLFVFIIPLAVAGALFAPEILQLLYGRDFATTGALLLLLIYFPTMAMMKIGTLTSTFMSAMDQERRLVTSRAIFGGVNILLNLILIPRFGALGALVGTTTASITGSIYECWVVHHSLHPHYPVHFVRTMLGASLIAGGVAILIKHLLIPLNPYTGSAGAAVILLGAGLPWFGVVLALFIALKPLSPETVEVIGRLPIPFREKVRELLI